MRRVPLFLLVLLLLAASAGEARALGSTDPLLHSGSWQLAHTGFPLAWDLSTGSSETVIAVLDTGVGPHADLGPQVPGYDFVDNDADPADQSGHGTGVAGVISAVPNNGIGIGGACWSCRVMPVRVLGGPNGNSWAHVAAGITWAVDHGADVLNLSLSASGADFSVATAVAYALAHDVVVVASAGNGDLAQAEAPAAYPGVISVGAVDSQDVRYTLASTQGHWGSNYGPSVSVAGPGCTMTTWTGERYATFCGTSAATPFVAALAGLLRSYNSSASGQAVADAIRASAVPHADFANGRIDAAAAMRALGGSQPLPAVPPAEPARGVAPRLELALRANKTRVTRGQLLAFTLTIISDIDASGAIGTISLPRGLEFVSRVGSRCTGRQSVSCQIGDLRAGGAYEVVVVARVRAGGPLTVKGTARTVDGFAAYASRQLVLNGR